MTLPPGLAVSVLKAIFQEVHVQVSDNGHFGIFYLPALDITRITWQKINCLLRVLNSYRPLAIRACCPLLLYKEREACKYI